MAKQKLDLDLDKDIEEAKKEVEERKKKEKKPREILKGEAAEMWNKFNSTVELDSVRRVRGGMDTTFLIIVILLLCYGSVMVFSSSYAFAEQNFGSSLFFVKKQLLWAGVGVAALVLFSHIDYRILRKFAVTIFCASYVLLWCVFIPGIGSSSHGATRWVDLKIISFQPSDIMKFAIVLILALYISCYAEKTHKFKYGILIPASLLVVVCASVIVQKHVSATVIIFLIGAVMILISGASAKWIAGICAVGATAVCVIIFFTDYASARV